MYNKLFTRILDSTIWLEPSDHRIVWITLIAAMDQIGVAEFGSIENLAARARVSVEVATKAITDFESPDPHDPTQEFEGRRVERIPGGWLVLNAGKYRDMVTRSVASEKSKERMRKWREKKEKSNGYDPLRSVTPSVSVSDAVSTELYVPQERDCDVVFDHWKQIFDHPRAKMDSKRQRVIERALKLYSTTQLTEAISGYRHSPHHMGENDRHTVYDDIEIFLRDAKHIDAGLRFNNAPGKALPPRPYLPDGTPNPEVF